jgi:tubulin--tyrosine ligase
MPFLGSADEQRTNQFFYAHLSIPLHPRAPRHNRPVALVRGDCAYATSQWRAAFARRPHWELLPTDAPAADVSRASVWIDEYEVLDWEAIMSPPYRIASSFCVRKGLGRKGAMAERLAAHAARCALCPLRTQLPETVLVDTYTAFHARPSWLDARSALSEALSDAHDAVTAGGPAARWILKPSITNKGAGIVFCADFDAVRAAVCAERDVCAWVLQRYEPAPLLLNPRSPRAGDGAHPAHKFHVRLYVLAVGALDVHVFREALLLFAPAPFAGAQFDDAAAHLTNSCVGAGHAAWHERDMVRALSELPALLARDGVVADAAAGRAWAARAFRDMCAAVAHAFSALEGDVAGYMPAPLCFEVYGVDFLLTSDGRAVLLEFNPSPDIAQTGTRLNPVIDAMIEGAVRVAVDARVTVDDGSGGAVAAGVRLAPPDAAAVIVDVEPTGAARGDATGVVQGAGADWAPGSSGAIFDGIDAEGAALAARVSLAPNFHGFALAYSKKWRMAHDNMRVAFA